MTPEEFVVLLVTERLYVMPPARCVPDTWYVCNDERTLQGFGSSPIAAAKDLMARREQKLTAAPADDLSFLE